MAAAINYIFPVVCGLMDKREWACAQLQKKCAELGKRPTKGDFDEKTRVRIKEALGPWPRALEAAGLKPIPTGRQNQPE